MSYIFSLVTLFISVVFISQVALYESYVLWFIHCLIIAVSSYSLFSYANRPYSLYRSFHIFSLFFFGISPIIQYKNGTQFWNGMPFTEYDYIVTSLVVLFSLLLFNFCYYIFNKQKELHREQKINKYFKWSYKPKLSNRQVFLMLALGVTSLCVMLYMNNFNILSLLFRGGEFGDKLEMDSSSNLILDKIFRPINIYCFLSLLIFYPRKHFVLKTITLLLTLITASPMGMARFSTAAMYLPIMLVFSPIFRKKNMFVFMMVFGLLVMFPFLNLFRNFASDTELSFGINTEMFLEGHFDSYSSLLRAIKFDVVTYGNQLFGVLLFFIPRAIWPTKPIGSGAFLCDELGLSFSNISCNFFAEGYVNFGFIGMILFVIAIAYIIAVADRMFWRNGGLNSSSFYNVIYLICIGLVFFVMRGDLMSSFAYTVGYIFSAIVVYKIIKN